MKDRQWSYNHSADNFGALQCRHRHRSGRSVTSSHKALGRPCEIIIRPITFPRRRGKLDHRCSGVSGKY